MEEMWFFQVLIQAMYTYKKNGKLIRILESIMYAVKNVISFLFGITSMSIFHYVYIYVYILLSKVSTFCGFSYQLWPNNTVY